MRATRFSIAFVVLCSVVMSGNAFGQAQAGLDAAYKREFAYLDAEARELEARVAQLDKEEQQADTQARSEIAALETQLLTLNATLAALEEQQRSIAKADEALTEEQAGLERLTAQAELVLSSYGYVPEKQNTNKDAPTEGSIIAGLERMFAQAAMTLAEGDGVKRVPGSFIGASGEQVKGELISIGRIAVYGVAQTEAGALAPAGQGLLKVWDEQSAVAAKAIAAGSLASGAGVPVFVFDNADQAIEKRHQLTFAEYTSTGGSIAWVIVGVGVVALLLMLLRTFSLLRAGNASSSTVHRLSSLLEQGSLAEAMALINKKKGALERVISSLLSQAGEQQHVQEDIVQEKILQELPALDRYKSALVVFATVSPLLGLLGTVAGMITTFQALTEFGNSDPKLVSKGISEALVGTEYGLVVAIPTLFFGNLLASWSERIKGNLELVAIKTLNRLHFVHPARRHGSGSAVLSAGIDTSMLKDQ